MEPFGQTVNQRDPMDGQRYYGQVVAWKGSPISADSKEIPTWFKNNDPLKGVKLTFG